MMQLASWAARRGYTGLVQRVSYGLRGAKSATAAEGASKSVSSVLGGYLGANLALPGGGRHLPVWAGGDVRAIVHNNLSDMEPKALATLDGRVWNAPVRVDLVHRVVVWQLACRRAGTNKTKSRSEVAYSGRKIRPQKGTGRSRQGARSSPIFRGGGRAHGPVPRDYSFNLPRGVRRAALRAVLTSKLACGQVWVVDEVGLGAKTAQCLGAFQNLGWKSALVVDVGIEEDFRLGSNVLKRVLPMCVAGLNVYDLLALDMLVVTRAALAQLHGRFEKYECLV